MSILDVPHRDVPFSITVAEHPHRLIRRYRPPDRVIWFTIRPERHIRVEILHGYKTEIAPVVTFRF